MRNIIRSFVILLMFTGCSKPDIDIKIIPNNQIWYTSITNKKIIPFRDEKVFFGANIISNVYENGIGIITFDDDVTMIGNATFHCTDLFNITIPNSVTSISSSAFSGCANLDKITIPNSVTSMGDCVFVTLYLEALNNQNYSEITKYKPLIINIF